MNPAERRPGRTVLAILFTAAFARILLRTAWLSDDSYIIFRTIDNFIHGYGLRWNAAERVQTFTDPLWTLLLSAFYAATREIYFTSLAVSIAVALAAFWLMARKIAVSASGAVLAATALLVSKAFVDYSTSGLENPLTHLLLACFLVVFLSGELRPKTLWRLSTIASLAAVNRPDTILLYLPALAWILFRLRSIRALAAASLGALPLIAWEIFSVLYYGFPFPNTAYAKLSTGLPSPALAVQGLIYLRQSFRMDPVTLTVICAGIFASFLPGAARSRWVGWGVLLYLLYIVRIGGDFMSGRFLSAPLFGAASLLACSRLAERRGLCAATAAVVFALGAAPPLSPLKSGRDYGERALHAPDLIDKNGICDERAFYYRQSGLLQWKRGRPMPDGPWAKEGRLAASRKTPLVVRWTIGQFGFFAGPSVHVVDALALGDALLARLPITGIPSGFGKIPSGGWRIGHFEREIPEGYLNTLLTGQNRIVDEHLAAYDDKLSLILRGPLFDPRRLLEIARMNLGRYDALIDDYVKRPSPRRLSLNAADMASPKTEGTAWDDASNVMMEEPGVDVALAEKTHAPRIEVSLDHNDAYEMIFLSGDAMTSWRKLPPTDVPESGLRVETVQAPEEAVREGYDRIRIRPLSGDGRYSLGHLRILP